VIVRLHEAAQLDIEEAALWYDNQEPGLGDELLAEVNQRIAGLALRPETWPLWPGARVGKYPVRRRMLGRFPYGIAYQIVGDVVVILALAAHKRRPRYWASRAQR
jgi:hypothetical protein